MTKKTNRTGEKNNPPPDGMDASYIENPHDTSLNQGLVDLKDNGVEDLCLSLENDIEVKGEYTVDHLKKMNLLQLAILTEKKYMYALVLRAKYGVPESPSSALPSDHGENLAGTGRIYGSVDLVMSVVTSPIDMLLFRPALFKAQFGTLRGGYIAKYVESQKLIGQILDHKIESNAEKEGKQLEGRKITYGKVNYTEDELNIMTKPGLVALAQRLSLQSDGRHREGTKQKIKGILSFSTNVVLTPLDLILKSTFSKERLVKYCLQQQNIISESREPGPQGIEDNRKSTSSKRPT